jgi:hypothetical protein
MRRKEMKDFVLVLAAVSGSLILGGCADQQYMPLVFGQSDTLGISISGSTTEQGAELTLGYKGRNIAIIPVIVKQADGTLINVFATRKGAENGDFADVLSVFGQFEAAASGGTATGTQPAVQASLGKFFATGLAALNISDGFAKKLAKEGVTQEQSGTQ